MKKNVTDSSGFILPTILLVIGLLGIVSVQAWSNLKDASVLISQTLHSSILRTELQSELLSKLPSASLSTVHSTNCLELEEEKGKLHLHRRLCIHRPTIAGFQTDLVFEGAKKCSSATALNSLRSPLGRSLTPSSFISATTCSQVLRPSVYHGNASLIDPFIPEKATAQALAGFALLASRGFLELRSTLSLERDTIVYAGGDLFLQSLESKNSSPLKVILLSSSGTIVLGEVSGAITLESYAKHGVYLPSGMSNSPGSFPLQRVERYVLGFH